MAISSIVIPPDAKRDAKARELMKTAHTWDYVTLNKPWGSFPTGTVCRQTPNGYRVNNVACTCPDYQGAGYICKHVRVMAMLQQPAPAPRKTIEDLWTPECDVTSCTEDRAKGSEYCRTHRLGEFY